MTLPLPRVVADVGPGGSVVTAMRGGNALADEMMQRKIREVEAQYAPYTNYANAASKIAYANFVGPQALAAFLSNPNSRGMVSPEQYKQLSQAFANQVGNSSNAFGMIPTPKPNTQSSGLLGMILDKIYQQPQTMPAPQGNMGLPQGAPMGAQPGAGMEQGNINVSPEDVSDQANVAPAASGLPMQQGQVNALPGTAPFTQRAASRLPPGVMGGANPAAIQKATEDAYHAQATGEAGSIPKQYEEMITQDTAAAKIQNEMLSLTKELTNVKGDMEWYQQGAVFGKLPAITSRTKQFETIRSNIENSIARASQQGHINVADSERAKNMKPGRDTNSKVFNELIQFSDGMSYRIIEKPNFDKMAQKAGYNPDETQIMWSYYNLKKPFFNEKTRKKDDDNLNSWEDFYSNPKNLEAAFSPKAQKELEKANTPTKQPNNKANNNQAPEKTGASAKLIAKDMQLPSFANAQEFQDWYKRQPKPVQDAVKLHLGK